LGEISRKRMEVEEETDGTRERERKLEGLRGKRVRELCCS